MRSEADAPFDSRGTLAKLRAAATKDAAKQACLHGLDHAAVGVQALGSLRGGCYSLTIALLFPAQPGPFH